MLIIQVKSIINYNKLVKIYVDDWKNGKTQLFLINIIGMELNIKDSS